MLGNHIARWSLVLGLVLLFPAASRATTRATNRATTPVRVDDHRLETEVFSALVSAPELDTSQVTVSVKDGVVTLKGHTRSDDDRIRQLIIATQVPGVRKVVDLVEPDWLRLKTSQALEQKIRNEIGADPTTAWVADGIHVSAYQGKVLLIGRVTTPLQREEAEQIARNTRGVSSVRDQLHVDAAYDDWLRFAAGPVELGEPFL